MDTPDDTSGEARSGDARSADERRAEAKSRLLGRLAAGLAHEIKNPLSTMAINLTLLEEEFQPAPGGDHAQSPKDKRSLKRVRTLQREVARLEGIVEEFLRYARGGEIDRSPRDLVALVREVLEFAEPELEAADVRLHASLPNALPLVMLDESAFRQAIVNLIVNARQAMPGGGELIVEVGREGAGATVTITDSGVGMSEEQVARCFDLYWSTKRGGTGLGLPTVRRIVELHGGDIEVQSEEGRGTQFRVWVPLLQEIAHSERRDSVVDVSPGGEAGSSEAPDDAQSGS